MSASPIRRIRASLLQNTWSRACLAAIAGTVLVIMVSLAFTWPAATASLTYFPIAIVHPEHVEQMPPMLMYADKDQFRLSVAANRRAAIHMIQARQVYGAIVLGTQPEVLYASANGRVVGAVMDAVTTGLKDRLASNAAMSSEVNRTLVRTTDVVPSRQATFELAFLALPLIIGSIIGAVLSAVLVASGWPRLSMLALYSGLAGLLVMAIVQGWLGLLPGPFAANAGAVALAVFATSSLMAGLYSRIGPPGLGLGILSLLLGANPISGLALPPQFLPSPWDTIGQWLPPGAAGSLLQDVVYFPAVPTAFPLLVLAGWLVVGSGLVLVGQRPSLVRQGMRYVAESTE